MIYPIEKASEFTKLCLDAWHENAQFWDETRVINDDVKNFILGQLEKESLTDLSIADIGCGNAWLLTELLANKNWGGQYTGLDHNDLFINANKIKHPQVEWFWKDFTKPLTLNKEFDAVISCLSLIEMANLEGPFRNFNKLLKSDGFLILVTLDPYFEIIRLNSNYKGLQKDFEDFRKSEYSKYYRKEILLNGKKTGKYYYGVLHSLGYLQKTIITNNFYISEFKELNFTHGSIAKPIYHAYVLKRRPNPKSPI